MIFNTCVAGLIRPQGKFVYGGTTYTLNGRDEVNVSGVFRYLPGSVGKEDWRMWILASGTLTFNVLIRNPQICVLGPGGNGGYSGGDSDHWWTGGGGGGGQIQTRTLAASNGMSLAININSTNTAVTGSASITSVRGGDGVNYDNPGVTGGGTGNGGYGRAWNGGYGGTGGSGAYAFGDSAFDGVLYGGGGCGGGEMTYPGATAGARGHGGQSDYHSWSADGGNGPQYGAVFMRYVG